MKFSFVVIACNQKSSICNTIDSVLDQDYEDLEVIYVDDGSTDGSADTVEQKYYSDKRVCTIRHPESRGCVISRLDGIKAATGDWILLGDGDDTYSRETCKVLVDTIHAHPNVNMIGFGVELVYLDNAGHIDREVMDRKYSEPMLGRASGKKLLDNIYLQQDKAWNVWNKCYSAALMRYLIDNAIADYLISSEDFYLSFIMCSAVDSYIGISNRLYNYTIGSGISTAKKLSLPAYKRHLTAAKCLEYTENYAKKHGLYEKFKRIFDQHRRDLIYASYAKIKLMREDEKLAAAKDFFDSFGIRNVISHLACGYRYECTDIGNHLNISGVFPYSKRPIKTVGMLYHRLYDGGVERVMSLLTPILQNAGYQVVLITNDPINERDYSLPVGTTRVSIGQIEYDMNIDDGYGSRYDALTNCIRENNIDAVIYHSWVAEELFWDLCTIKSTGAACIIHSHNIFFKDLSSGYLHCVKSDSIFRHADVMVVLSEADRYYWAGCNNNIHQVNNPLTFDPKKIPKAKQDNHNVIWTGRFDPIQKNPYDILYIFSEVIKTVPDAKLFLVGTGEPDVLENMHGICKDLNLDEHVVFTGYTKDVGAYLQKAAVYLFTSDFEGYSMAFAEALSYGLPIVSYPLPYMTMARESKATIQVGWKDIQGAANAVADLLTNDVRRHEMSCAAREEALAYGAEDLSVTWNRIFESLEHHEVPEHYVVDKRFLEDYQKTVNLAFTQMAYAMHNPIGSVWFPVNEAFDYRNMSKPKRWLTYLVYDRGTLKRIVKNKIKNHPLLLKIGKFVWKVLKKLKRFLIK